MQLRAENIIKKYRSRIVVNGVSVAVDQGEIVGLLGPNGAGKTTSFYMMVGLVKPNGGKVFLDTQEITDMPMYKRAQMGVGYLAQEASIFRKLSVEDNILAVLQMTGLSKQSQQEKLESLKLLSKQNSKLLELFDISNDYFEDGIIFLDNNGVIQRFNRKILTFFDKEYSEFDNRRAFSIFS